MSTRFVCKTESAKILGVVRHVRQFLKDFLPCNALPIVTKRVSDASYSGLCLFQLAMIFLRFKEPLSNPRQNIEVSTLSIAFKTHVSVLLETFLYIFVSVQ